MTTDEMTTNEEGKVTTNGRGKGLIAGGLIAGGLIGAALGILYAPRSGKETREEIRHSAEGFVKKAKDRYEETTRKIENLASRQKEAVIGKKERMKKALECGAEVFRKGEPPSPQA